MFQVMAARLFEEEQTQRTMVALREMAPFYPGKTPAEVISVLERVSGSCDGHVMLVYRFVVSSRTTRQRLGFSGSRHSITAEENRFLALSLVHTHKQTLSLSLSLSAAVGSSDGGGKLSPAHSLEESRTGQPQGPPDNLATRKLSSHSQRTGALVGHCWVSVHTLRERYIAVCV